MAEATAQKTKPETAPKPVAKTSKRAVISTGGHQFLVGVGDELLVELLDPAQQNTAFEVLLVIDGDTISVGTPTVTGVKVTADILEQSVKDDKVVAIRYKAKKRVRKVRGHRQRHARIKITGIK
jgi:large subunit ribosomal protein L21